VTKSAGHGDFHPIVLAPATVQEAIDLTVLAFDLAEKYRTLAFVVADGAIGQMMEPAELPPMRPMPKKRPSWALTGAAGREKNIVTSLYLGSVDLERLNQDLQLKLARIKLQEARYEEMFVEDAEIIVVAFGTAARVAQTAVQRLRQQGINIGLFRPITLWPFPEQRLTQLTYLTKKFFVVEMNAGQMVHDVREIVGGQAHVQFVGRMGGTIPMPDEVETAVIDWLSVQEER
jgi:2-oxoglutarate ferredoxin oxidoreductase subunit alpha